MSPISQLAFYLVHVTVKGVRKYRGLMLGVTSLRDAVRIRSTQPCILEEVVDRDNLGHNRPLPSMDHYIFLHHFSFATPVGFNRESLLR
ncbi:hypothetical protein [Nostoc sp.]|uniref:hypothetical protein n=1 Tax=Nostoc sp. TaxID=1180 RepID=UPI002FF45003